MPGLEPNARGRAVQLDPVKPTLKAPGTRRLTLKSYKLLSTFAFNFNLRRFTVGVPPRGRCGGGATQGRAVQVDPIKPTLKAPGTKRQPPDRSCYPRPAPHQPQHRPAAGAYTRPHFGST